MSYVSSQKAMELLGISRTTLRSWAKNNKIDTIRTVGNHRRYNVQKYLHGSDNVSLLKMNICYARVSTLNQKPDLVRQINYLQLNYPSYKLITDIGSGINFNRRGLRQIIHYAISGNINNLVIVHKDRLVRFGFDLIEDLITKYSNGKIIIMSNDHKKEPKEELVDDVLQILNVYTAKLNGMRKYKNIQMSS